MSQLQAQQVTSSLQGQKLCTQCGADVTAKQRMKDSRGKYWCMPCGTADQQRKTAASTKSTGPGMTCPACQKGFSPMHATKHGQQYICPDCAKKKVGSLKTKIAGKPAGAAADNGSTKMIAVVALVAVAVVTLSVMYVFRII